MSEAAMSVWCRLGLHRWPEPSGVGYCERGCGALMPRRVTAHGWIRHVEPPKRGGYQGSFDPGEPTRLMQPQTVPVRSRFAWSPRQAFWKRLGLMFNRWAEACYRKGRR